MSEDDFFGAKTEEQKQEQFMLSTMRLILKQRGVAPGVVNPGATWEWFNNEYPIPGLWVGSQRVFHFNFVDLLFRPTKNPVLTEFHAFADTFSFYHDMDPLLIFKVYDWGSMYVTTADFPDTTALRVVVRDKPLWVAPLGTLFTKWPHHG